MKIFFNEIHCELHNYQAPERYIFTVIHATPMA